MTPGPSAHGHFGRSDRYFLRCQLEKETSSPDLERRSVPYHSFSLIVPPYSNNADAGNVKRIAASEGDAVCFLVE